MFSAYHRCNTDPVGLKTSPGLITLALISIAASGHVQAQMTYYVSTLGNDSNDGLDPSSAFATLQKAADMVGPGDTVRVSAGTYRGFFLDSRSGTANSPITFSAEPGVDIEGEGSKACQRHETVCLWESNNVVIEGFEIIGRHCGYGQCDVLSARADGGQRHATQGVVIRRNKLHETDSRGLYITFGVHVTIEDNEIYDSSIGIYFANGAPASYGDEDSVISGNDIHDNSDIAIHVNADASSPGDGIIRGLLVEGNRVIRNAGQGIHFDGVCDSKVQNNLVLETGRGIIVSRVDGALSPENDIVVNNTVVQSPGSRVCLRVGGGTHDITVFNNVFIHLGGTALDLEDSRQPFLSDYNAVSGLQAVRRATGGDEHSLEVSLDNAGFTNPRSGDYSITESSPLRNAGSCRLGDIDAPARDITGAERPADGSCDIGAYEYQGQGERPGEQGYQDRDGAGDMGLETDGQDAEATLDGEPTADTGEDAGYTDSRSETTRDAPGDDTPGSQDTISGCGCGSAPHGGGTTHFAGLQFLIGRPQFIGNMFFPPLRMGLVDT